MFTDKSARAVSGAGGWLSWLRRAMRSEEPRRRAAGGRTCEFNRRWLRTKILSRLDPLRGAGGKWSAW